MFAEIRKEIQKAAKKKQKLAMMHFQVLKHSRELADTAPAEFCKLVEVPETYATEFRKMMSLARVMEEQGAQLPQG